MRLWHITVILAVLLLAVTLAGTAVAVNSLAVSPLRHERVHGDIITLNFAGDIMAHNINYNRPPYDAIYDDIREILLNDDLSFANLEFPVDPGKPMSTYPQFNQHAGYVQAAMDAGFDVFALANNHTTDQGASSVIVTSRTLHRMGQTSVSGIRRHPGDVFHPVSLYTGSWRVGFLSITLMLNLQEGHEYVHTLNIFNRARVDAFLEFIRETAASYDLFILSVHGGTEYRQYPEEWRSDVFLEFLEAGADIVWGHHPHVLQPWDYVHVSGRRKLVMYSTGNLISGQAWTNDGSVPDDAHALRGETALFEVRVQKDGDRINVIGVTPRFLFNHRQGTMVIRRAESLLEDPSLSPEWSEHYRKRYEGLLLFAAPLDGDRNSREGLR